VTDEESQHPQPLQYATPRRDPPVWTASRILVSVFVVPAGMIVGLLGGTLIVGCLLSGPRDVPPVVSGLFLFALPILFIVTLVIQAHQTKFLARLFFIGATIGATIICLAIAAGGLR